jgi:predicted Zn-dependent peptidase
MDLISDLLSRGNSARLYNALVKNKKMFSEISAYLMGDIDKGMFVISGKLLSGISFMDAEAAVFAELEKLKQELIGDKELQKVKNKMEATILFGEMSVPDIAMNLAFFELYEDADGINKEVGKYLAVTPEKIRQQASQVLNRVNCSALFYESKNKN